MQDEIEITVSVNWEIHSVQPDGPTEKTGKQNKNMVDDRLNEQKIATMALAKVVSMPAIFSSITTRNKKEIDMYFVCMNVPKDMTQPNPTKHTTAFKRCILETDAKLKKAGDKNQS